MTVYVLRRYEPFARHAHALLAAACDIAAAEPLAHTGLPAMLRLIDGSCATAPQAETVPERLSHLQTHLTLAVHAKLCAAVAPTRRGTVALLLCAHLREAAGESTATERVFLQHGAATDLAAQQLAPADAPARPPAQGLAMECWHALSKLAALPGFAGVCEAIAAAPALWEPVLANSSDADCSGLPEPFNALTTWQRVLLARAACADSLPASAAAFVAEHLGAALAQAMSAATAVRHPLEAAMSAGSPTLPVILRLGPGDCAGPAVAAAAAVEGISLAQHTPSASGLVTYPLAMVTSSACALCACGAQPSCSKLCSITFCTAIPRNVEIMRRQS